LSPTLMG